MNPAIPRSDMKEPVKTLLQRFGDLRGNLHSPLSELLSVNGIGEIAVTVLHIIRKSATLHLQETSAAEEAFQDSWNLSDFWRLRIGALKHEVFAVAYLDSAYRLPRKRERDSPVLARSETSPSPSRQL